MGTGGSLALAALEAGELEGANAGVGEEGVELVDETEAAEDAEVACLGDILAVFEVLYDGAADAGILGEAGLGDVLVEPAAADALGELGLDGGIGHGGELHNACLNGLWGYCRVSVLGKASFM